MFSFVSKNTASAPFGVAQQQNHKRVLLAKLASTFSYLTSAVDGGADKLGGPNDNIEGAQELHKHTWRLKESTRREKTNGLRRVLKVRQRRILGSVNSMLVQFT